MMIRVLLLAALAGIGWFVFLRRNQLPFHIMTLFALLIAGAIAVIVPDETKDEVAHFFGVGRGTDLATYIAIITVMFVLLHYYTKFVETQRKLTEVTRELAILRAEVERLGKGAVGHESDPASATKDPTKAPADPTSDPTSDREKPLGSPRATV